MTSNPQLAKLEAVLEPLQKAAAKAAKSAETPFEWERVRTLKRRATLLKMMVSESAREHDPAMLARAMRGQGVPLFENSHALGDDIAVKYL